MLTGDDIPDWARTGATLLLGAGAARLFGVWLENRRLATKDYRETLLERIQDLERQLNGLNERVGNLRVEVAHLEEALEDERERVERLDGENERLRARLLEVDSDRNPDIGG